VNTWPTLLHAVPIDVPIDPDRAQARRWVLEELSRKEYQSTRPGLIERLLTWVQDRFAQVRPGFDSPVQLTVTVLAVLALAAAAYAVWRSGGVRRQFRRRGGAVLPARATTAADHRGAADRYAAADRWDEAILERFRAITRELSERGLVPAAPGATAAEVAAAGASVLPALATDLREAAHAFDDICYGHLDLPAQDGRRIDARLRLLDEQVRTSRAQVPGGRALDRV